MYWGLIATFTLLYLLVAFVSTLHAIDFFGLTNNVSLAILLGVAYEVGQASVLFSILMTKNKEKFLPWALMFLLTGLQVTANVYASFKHMTITGSDDWTYWYTSILKIFGVTGGSTETYQVIISWISGALLPIVALGMTALVANNIKLITEDGDDVEDGSEEPIDAKEIISEVSRIRPSEEDLAEAEQVLSKKEPIIKEDAKDEIEKIKKIIEKEERQGGTIPDEIKKVLSPGIDKEDETTPVIPEKEEPKVELHPQTTIDTPTKEKPAVAPEIIGNADGVFIDGRKLEHIDDVPFPPEEEPKNMGEVLTDVAQRAEELSSSEPASEPQIEVKEPEPEPVVYESPVPPESVPPEPTGTPNEETEEERLERLRNVARENLKKK